MMILTVSILDSLNVSDWITIMGVIVAVILHGHLIVREDERLERERVPRIIFNGASFSYDKSFEESSIQGSVFVQDDFTFDFINVKTDISGVRVGYSMLDDDVLYTKLKKLVDDETRFDYIHQDVDDSVFCINGVEDYLSKKFETDDPRSIISGHIQPILTRGQSFSVPIPESYVKLLYYYSKYRKQLSEEWSIDDFFRKPRMRLYINFKNSLNETQTFIFNIELGSQVKYSNSTGIAYVEIDYDDGYLINGE